MSDTKAAARWVIVPNWLSDNINGLLASKCDFWEMLPDHEKAGLRNSLLDYFDKHGRLPSDFTIEKQEVGDRE